MAFSLNDDTFEILVDPPIGQFDSIAVDNDGNLYLSLWEINEVYRYGPDLTNSPETVFSFAAGAANIEFNARDDILILPMFDLDTLFLVNLYADFSVDRIGPAPRKCHRRRCQRRRQCRYSRYHLYDRFQIQERPRAGVLRVLILSEKRRSPRGTPFSCLLYLLAGHTYIVT